MTRCAQSCRPRRRWRRCRRSATVNVPPVGMASPPPLCWQHARSYVDPVTSAAPVLKELYE